jgi:hypothetical protein
MKQSPQERHQAMLVKLYRSGAAVFRARAAEYRRLSMLTEHLDIRRTLEDHAQAADQHAIHQDGEATRVEYAHLYNQETYL